MVDLTLIAADWWSWLIPLVFIVIYLVNHMLTGGNANAGKPRRPQPQRRRGPGGERPLRPAPGQPQQPGNQSQLNTEIEQFLKRANQRRMDKARREAPPARPAAKPPLAAPPPPLREEPIVVEPIRQQDFDAVEDSVRSHLGNRGFAEHLAVDVSQADEEMEQHLKQVFEHRLGRLDRGSAVKPAAPDEVQPPVTRADSQATAKALAGLLANQQDVRQAIVLKEILERPIDRW